MGFIYQEANAYGVEALVALGRHYTPTEEKYCTAVTEAVRICDTYGIPERELVPQVRHIAAAEEYLLEHLSEDEETLQFLFTPLSGSNTCLAWFLVWDYVRPGGEKAYKYTGHTPQQRLRDIISAVGQYQEDPLPPAAAAGHHLRPYRRGGHLRSRPHHPHRDPRHLYRGRLCHRHLR